MERKTAPLGAVSLADGGRGENRTYAFLRAKRATCGTTVALTTILTTICARLPLMPSVHAC